MTKPDEERGGLGYAIVGIALILLPVLYVLGVGPAVWLDNCYLNGIPFLRAAYRPLTFLMECYEPIAHALDWYIKFWQ